MKYFVFLVLIIQPINNKDGRLLEPELVCTPLKKYHGMSGAGDLIHGRGADGGNSDSDSCTVICSGPGDVAVQARLSASQPASAFKPTRSPSTTSSSNSDVDKGGFGGFTQPAQVQIGISEYLGTGRELKSLPRHHSNSAVSHVSFQMSDLFCGTQSGTQTQTQSQTQFQRLVKRMTRFWVKTSITETEKFLSGLLAKLNYSFRCKSRGIVST